MQPNRNIMPGMWRLAWRGPGLALLCFALMGAQVIMAQVNASAPATAAGVPVITPVVVAPEEKPDNTPPTSIFFSHEDLQRVKNALEAYERSKREKQNTGETKANDFLNQLTDTAPAKPPEPKMFTYPQFFLNSLVYHTSDDWVVLVNGQRFSSQVPQQNAELRVVGVDSDKVTLEWHPQKLDKVMESWDRGPNPDVTFDRVNGIVTFTLLPNQTFSTYVMRAAEGKLAPMTVNLRPNEP